MPTYLSSVGYRHPWGAVTVTLFQRQLPKTNCTKRPHHRGRIYLHLQWLSQNCYLFPLSIPLFQFSFHGQEQGFSKSQRISCLLCIRVEKERTARKQQGSGRCTAEKCARARRKTPAVNPSINGARKWHCLDIFSKREGKYICDPCKYILTGHGVKCSS